ncbi:hypothetical protein Tco_0539956 [Tanacetum coccineum]
MFVAYTNEGRWEVKTLIEDHNCIQSREIKACTSRFLSDHVIKTLATNPDIHVRAVQDQMQKQFDVGVSKMTTFKAKRIATYKITSSFREQYSLLREYAQELINQNPGTTVRIDVQQEPNPDIISKVKGLVLIRNVNSGSVEKDTHVYDLCALETLARNAYDEAAKQQRFAQKVQQQK